MKLKSIILSLLLLVVAVAFTEAHDTSNDPKPVKIENAVATSTDPDFISLIEPSVGISVKDESRVSVVYTSCGSWGAYVPQWDEPENYTYYVSSRACQEYLIDFSTLPPTVIVTNSYQEYRFIYP